MTTEQQHEVEVWRKAHHWQPNQHTKADDATPAEDYARLNREEMEVLCEMHRKAKGEPPLAQSSDLDYPCIADPDHPDGGYWPNGMPPDDKPDDPLLEPRKRVARKERQAMEAGGARAAG